MQEQPKNQTIRKEKRVNMKKAFLSVLIALVSAFASSGWAVDFDVNTVAGLRTALTTAESNGENDTINIAAGTYNTSGSTFSYDPVPGENYSLTLVGAGAGSTVLDGGNSDQVMNIGTTGLADDSNGHITVRGITFQNGDTPGGAFEDGGGLCIETNQANITAEDCEFSGNTADVYGGAVYGRSFAAGTVTFTNNIFDGNTANVYGGGVYGRSSTGNMTFTNNTFNGNTAQNAGGGAESRSQGTITFTNNTSRGNTVNSGGGGGLHISLDGNSATGNIYNNIAWNNTASGDGDDIYVDDDYDGDLGGASVNLYNNDYGPDPDPNDFAISVGDNLSRGNNIHTDPLLVDPAGGDLHLQAVSPCIDAGTATAPSLPATDFDGEPRPSASGPDMGADEVQSGLPLVDSDSGGGCFIATAAYGSRMANEVKVLKKVRDEYLLTSELGKAFVSAYYEHSPPLADWVAKHPVIGKVVKISLYPVIGLGKLLLGENPSQ
jgi:predicted outer membrane repeat protein